MPHAADAFAALPTVNAVLNALAAALLLRGRGLARAGRVIAHRRTMLAAFAVSTLFLVSYVVHKASRDFESTTFHVQGVWKSLYLGLLASHVVLAAFVPLLAIALIVLALRGRIQTHRRLARIVWPIWMYVSTTGVVIYALLYHFNPAPPPTAATPVLGLDRDARDGLPTRPAKSAVRARESAPSTGAGPSAQRTADGLPEAPGPIPGALFSSAIWNAPPEGLPARRQA